MYSKLILLLVVTLLIGCAVEPVAKVEPQMELSTKPPFDEEIKNTKLIKIQYYKSGKIYSETDFLIKMHNTKGKPPRETAIVNVATGKHRYVDTDDIWGMIYVGFKIQNKSSSGWKRLGTALNGFCEESSIGGGTCKEQAVASLWKKWWNEQFEDYFSQMKDMKKQFCNKNGVEDLIIEGVYLDMWDAFKDPKFKRDDLDYIWKKMHFNLTYIASYKNKNFNIKIQIPFKGMQQILIIKNLDSDEPPIIYKNLKANIVQDVPVQVK